MEREGEKPRVGPRGPTRGQVFFGSKSWVFLKNHGFSYEIMGHCAHDFFENFIFFSLLRECACGRVPVWACRRAGVQACGRAGLWACGLVCVSASGPVGVWPRGSAGVWAYGRVGVRACGRPSLWACGRVSVRACVGVLCTFCEV